MNLGYGGKNFHYCRYLLLLAVFQLICSKALSALAGEKLTLFFQVDEPKSRR